MPDISHEELVKSFPESVRNWLNDPAVYSAVNHIAAIKKDELAEGLQWDEFEPFLEARAMAHLTRAEYPIALFRFWKAIWGGVFGRDWRQETIDENGHGLLGPQTTWDDENMAVKFTKGDSTLHTLVGLGQLETTVAFALEDKNGNPLIDTSDGAFEWHGSETDWNEYLVAGWHDHSLTDEAFNWPALIEARDHALKMINQKLA